MSHHFFTSWRLPLLAVIAVLIIPRTAAGQGYVSGVVVDGPSREPIEGVTVVLAGTLFGTVTGPDGTFSLGPVPDGEYELQVIRAGYEPVEIAAVVPGGRIVLQLGKERPDLPADAFAVYGANLRMGAFPARGDPILGESSSALTRVPGVTARWYGLAFLDPMIRGFGEGRSNSSHGSFSSTTLEVPGVGRIDLQSLRNVGGSVHYGVTPLSDLAVQSALWVPGEAGDDATYGRAAVEARYQTNLDAFETSGYYLGRVDDTRYRLIASHAESLDFKAATGQSVDASFKRTSGLVTVDHQFAQEGSIRFAGQFSEARSADVPGAQGSVDYGRLIGGSLGFQISPERKLLRRLSGSLSATRSDLTIDHFESGAILGDVERGSFLAVAAADMFHPWLETLQAGIRLGYDAHDGQIQSPDGSLRSSFWPGVDVLSAETFFTASQRSLAIRAAIDGRIGVARFQPEVNLSDESMSLPARTDLVGSLAASVVHRRGRFLSMMIGLSVVRRSPSVLQRYAAPHLPVDGARAIIVSGYSGLDPEWTYTLDSGLTARTRSLTIRLRPFLSVVREFIASRPVDGTVNPIDAEEELWAFRNGSATFWGYELSASYAPIPFVSVSGHFDYTRATDHELDGPAAGVPPFSGRFDVTASSPDERVLLEVSSEFALSADRVAVERGNLPAPGHVLFHWWLGLPLKANVLFRVGVYNLFNTSFYPQPGLLSRENDMRIPGPGRSWLFSVKVTA